MTAWPLTAPAPPIPYQWVCLDCETIAGRPESAEEWARRFWSPSPTWKASTIGERWLQAVEGKKAKLALLDDAPIIIVAVENDRHERRCLHWMIRHEPKTVDGACVEAFGTEADMLLTLRTLLETCCDPTTTIVGHNLHFDLAKLRLRFVHNKLRVPGPLLGDQPTFCTMRQFSRFSTTEKPFIGLGDLLEVVGLANHKTNIDGSDVQALYEAGRFDELVGYAIADVKATASIFELMTGQAAGGR